MLNIQVKETPLVHNLLLDLYVMNLTHRRKMSTKVTLPNSESGTAPLESFELNTVAVEVVLQVVYAMFCTSDIGLRLI